MRNGYPVGGMIVIMVTWYSDTDDVIKRDAAGYWDVAADGSADWKIDITVNLATLYEITLL